MLTKYLLHKSLGMPIMMTNLYPFLMGQAALKHERIPHFPPVEGNPDDYILAAHCGYLGVVPPSFATEWKLRSKVLAIVDNNATAIDARLPEGAMTLAKLHPTHEQADHHGRRNYGLCAVRQFGLPERGGDSGARRPSHGQHPLLTPLPAHVGPSPGRH
jgi:hypothetical protein